MPFSDPLPSLDMLSPLSPTTHGILSIPTLMELMSSFTQTSSQLLKDLLFLTLLLLILRLTLIIKEILTLVSLTPLSTDRMAQESPTSEMALLVSSRITSSHHGESLLQRSGSGAQQLTLLLMITLTTNAPMLLQSVFQEKLLDLMIIPITRELSTSDTWRSLIMEPLRLSS